MDFNTERERQNIACFVLGLISGLFIWALHSLLI
jgi:hypothetical protein